MKSKRYLPVTFAAIALIGVGAVVATAQDADTGTGNEAQPEARQAMPTHMRGERHERGNWGRRGHRGGPRGSIFGGSRGDSEIFTNLFNAVDGDGDGSVTQDEVDAFRAAKLGEADADDDGALSIEEFDQLYREFTRSRMVDMFQDLDANGNGEIDTDEMDTRFGGVVARMDRDGDGVLTLRR